MKKNVLYISLILLVSVTSFFLIKRTFFENANLDEPIKNVINYYNNTDLIASPYVKATTRPYVEETSILTDYVSVKEDDDEEIEEISKYPYSVAPKFTDDGSIIYDGMTLTELTDKLNKSLSSYLTNTGIFFAEYTKDTGLDPYLAVSIVLLETGCNWTCSSLTVKCNNIGGLKGSGSCNGGSYSQYATLEQGIIAYLNIIYNNYFLKGMDTADKMASTYAASSQWSNKVNTYYKSVKAK